MSNGKTIATSDNKRMLLVKTEDGKFQVWTRATPTCAMWRKWTHPEEVAREIFEDFNATFPVRDYKAPVEAKVIAPAPKKVVRKVSGTSPVAKFKELYAANSDKTRKEILELAVAAGINKGTASTYYYKLKAEQ